MSLKTWEINGVSLYLDLQDVETMERYESAFEKMGEEENEIPKDGKQSVRIRAHCELYRRLYDRIFGEGTADRIFKGIPMHIGVYEDVYLQFLGFVREQVAHANKQRTEILTKYSPNRAQKRAAKKR